MLFGGLITARLTFVALYFEDYLRAPWRIIDIRDGGFIFAAGIAAALIIGVYQAKKSRLLRFPLSVAAAGALSIWLAGTLTLAKLAPTPPSIATLPLTTLHGEPYVYSPAGKPVVVNLWATWCPPCVQELPSLNRLHQEFEDRGLVELRGLSGERPIFVLPRIVQNKDGSWPASDETFKAMAWAMTAHEARPGHELQFARMLERGVSTARVVFAFNSANAEGWALYAERLMEELGFLDDPADLLGMLDAQSLRAARVIVDIGMHLELRIPEDNRLGAGGAPFHPGETWTPELGLEFMRLHCRMDDEFIQFEVKRYLGLPGQAPAYKVGERIWLEARAGVQERQGDDFDLKAFHRAALDLGSLGLDPLRAALERM